MYICSCFVIYVGKVVNYWIKLNKIKFLIFIENFYYERFFKTIVNLFIFIWIRFTKVSSLAREWSLFLLLLKWAVLFVVCNKNILYALHVWCKFFKLFYVSMSVCCLYSKQVCISYACMYWFKMYVCKQSLITTRVSHVDYSVRGNHYFRILIVTLLKHRIFYINKSKITIGK